MRRNSGRFWGSGGRGSGSRVRLVRPKREGARGEGDDKRDPVVSEEKGREGARAGGLTRVCADGWAGKGKERKGKLPERVSFLFFFLI